MIFIMLGVFLDTETNGLDRAVHRILEIALFIIDLTTNQEIAHYSALVQLSPSEWEKSSPTSLAFTGITFQDLEKKGKPREVIQKELIDLFKKNNIVRGKAVFICQNPSFDRLFFSHIIPVERQESLFLPYYWLDLASMHWFKEISKGTRPGAIDLSKDKIASLYQIPAEEMPHRADRGAAHLLACYRALTTPTR